MYPEDQGIFASQKKPGPLTRATIASGIANVAAQPAVTEQRQQGGQGITAGLQSNDPDTDGRRQYSASYGDAFANRGGSPTNAPIGPSNGPDSTALASAASGIAAPTDSARTVSPVASSRATQGIAALHPVSALIGAVDQGADAVGKPEVKQQSGNHGVSQNNGISATPMGRNDQGVITAETAQATVGNPMLRSGGIAGSYDGKGVNEIMARENATRQEMINNQITQPSPTGIAAPPVDQVEIDNAEKTRRWAIEDAVSRAPANQRAALTIQAMNHDQSNQTAQRGLDKASATADSHNNVIMRGQDIGSRTDASRLAVENPLKQAQTQGILAQNDSAKALSDLQSKYQAETDPAKQAAMAEQIRVITGKGRADTSERLSLPQHRSNAEIDAARNAVAGLTPQEIQRKTAKTTNTGRENPDFDPTLERAVTLSGRRKVGADDHFDQRQQAQQPAGNDGDVMTRFRSDQAMQGHKLGKQTEQGTEVFDASGRLIGHYQ